LSATTTADATQHGPEEVEPTVDPGWGPWARRWSNGRLTT